MERRPEQLRIRIRQEAPAEYEPMRWEEAREMAAGGIEFGAYTRTYPILSRVATSGFEDAIASALTNPKTSSHRDIWHTISEAA